MCSGLVLFQDNVNIGTYVIIDMSAQQVSMYECIIPPKPKLLRDARRVKGSGHVVRVVGT